MEVLGLIITLTFITLVLGASQKGNKDYLEYKRNHPDE